MIKRGFGVRATIAKELTPVLANAAEQAGYQTFWVNDVEGGNGLEQLALAQDATSTIRLGVGVLPVDRWSAELIAETVDRLQLDQNRLLVGIGSGTYLKGSLEKTGNVAQELKCRTASQVFIGALGPKMCRLAGTDADGVLLNWLVPEAVGEQSGQTREGALSMGKLEPEIIAYVRTASSADAQAALQIESDAYYSYAAYRRSFDRMGVHAIDTTINGSSAEISERFEAFAPHADEVVARAITADESMDGYLAVLNAAAPTKTI